MKYVIIYFLLLTSYSSVFTQMNDIIPFDFGNPNALDLYSFNNGYALSVIYVDIDGNGVSSVVQVLGSDYHYSFDDKMVYSISGLGVVSNSFLSNGKDRSKNKGLILCKNGNDEICTKTMEIETESSFNFLQDFLSLVSLT